MSSKRSMKASEHLMRLYEVAKMVGVSETKLSSMTKRGFPAPKRCRHSRGHGWDRAEVVEWLQRNAADLSS